MLFRVTGDRTKYFENSSIEHNMANDRLVYVHMRSSALFKAALEPASALVMFIHITVCCVVQASHAMHVDVQKQ